MISAFGDDALGDHDAVAAGMKPPAQLTKLDRGAGEVIGLRVELQDPHELRAEEGAYGVDDLVDFGVRVAG